MNRFWKLVCAIIGHRWGMPEFSWYMGPGRQPVPRNQGIGMDPFLVCGRCGYMRYTRTPVGYRHGAVALPPSNAGAE